MELSLAIMWSIILILDIASALTGGTPSWFSVFCPLLVLVLRYWMDYLSKRLS